MANLGFMWKLVAVLLVGLGIGWGSMSWQQRHASQDASERERLEMTRDARELMSRTPPPTTREREAMMQRVREWQRRNP